MSRPGRQPPVTASTPLPRQNAPLPTSAPQNVGSVPLAAADVPEVKEDALQAFMLALYDTSRITPDELAAMYEAVSYKGFNRKDVLKQLFTVVRDPRVATEIILAVALQGPQRASRTKLTVGQTPVQLGIPASGGKGTKALTLNKVLSATADLAASIMKRLDVPKRLNIDLPAWLQFPSAGSIKLPERYRLAHVEFSRSFSVLIGGAFNEQIYMAMQANAYLDDSLHLFD